MSGRISDDGDDAASVRALAQLFNLPLQDVHVPEAAAAWRMMQPHLARVRASELAPDDEPASLFRP